MDKDDLFKLIILFWAMTVLYLLYNMWIDLAKITDLVYIYMKLALESIKK